MAQSNRYVIKKYQKLVEDYLNLGSTEIENYILTGSDLLDFIESFREINENYNFVKEELEDTKGLSTKLVKNLERMFKGKKGEFADEMKLLLEEAKESFEK